MEETITLYLGLKDGTKPDFEVVGRAAAAFAEAVREVAFIIDPSLEVTLEFDSGTIGSRKLNGTLKANKGGKNAKAILVTIVVVVCSAFYRNLPHDLRQYGVGKLLDSLLGPQQHEFSDKDIERLAKRIKEMSDGKIAKDEVQQVYKEIDRDTKIDSVGSVTKPDDKPPAPVPREEFPVRAGIVQAVETSPQHREKVTTERLTLTRPVLVKKNRLWRFTSAAGEQSYEIAPEILEDLLSGKRKIPLRDGVQMTAKIRTKETLQSGVWTITERKIIEVVRVHRENKSDLFSQPPKRKTARKKKR